MAHLLHLDASARHAGSYSRELSAAFAAAWRRANPQAEVSYRDLAASPVPHVDEAHVTAMGLPADRHDPRQAASWAVSQEVVAEVLVADVVLIGTPMYNFSIPSALKAWLDRIAVPALLADRETGKGPLSGKRFVVVTARGGAYGPGTPRERFDFQEPYLRAAFEMLGVIEHLSFVHGEFTKAHTEPHLLQFRQLAEASLTEAHRAVRELAAAAVPVG